MQLINRFQTWRSAAVAALLGIGTLLAGCASNNEGFASLQEAAKHFPRAQYQILGKTENDQYWIDQTIEAEVAGFKFARPARRPASWDMPVKAPRRVVATPVARTVTVSPPVTPGPPVNPVKPKTQTQKLKERIKQLEEQLRAKFRRKPPSS